MLKRLLPIRPAFLLLIPAFIGLAVYLYPGATSGYGFSVLEESEAISRLNNELRTPTSAPAVYYISAAWCFECPQFERDILKNAEVKELLKGYAKFKIDATADPGVWPALASFNIDSVPTLIVHDSGGIRILRASGLLPLSAVTSFLQNR